MSWPGLIKAVNLGSRQQNCLTVKSPNLTRIHCLQFDFTTFQAKNGAQVATFKWLAWTHEKFESKSQQNKIGPTWTVTKLQKGRATIKIWRSSRGPLDVSVRCSCHLKFLNVLGGLQKILYAFYMLHILWKSVVSASRLSSWRNGHIHHGLKCPLDNHY